MKTRCQRCREVVSSDMKYACPEGAACPVFGRGEVFSLASMLGDGVEVGITGSLEDQWIEGAWENLNSAYWQPVFPADAPDFLWLWTEDLKAAYGPEPMPIKGAKGWLIVHGLVFTRRHGRNPRWFWRPIHPVEPPKLG